MIEKARLWEGRPEEEWRIRLGIDVVRFLQSTRSTNEDALELHLGAAETMGLVVADEQTGGRGTRGRSWSSPATTSLSMTLVIRRSGPPPPCLTLLVGLAVARGIEEVVPGVSAELKWPNDLLLRGRKVCGILCEATDGRLLVGIGINVNQSALDLPAELRGTATSLSLEAGAVVPRGALLSSVVPRIQTTLLDAAPHIGPSDLEALNRRSPLRGQHITVTGAAHTEDGGMVRLDRSRARAGDVLETGALEVRTPDGSSLHLVSGSLRALDGDETDPASH